ncbi:MAG: AAA family ATPase, partial [Sandaracinaceae bacterium]|nr:AAA family ATPase [Sandaracinaceae bacterium]
MARLGYRAHGAARLGAGLGPAPELPPELPDAGRLLAAVVLLTQDALSQGSTRVPIDEEALDERAKALGMDAALRSRITNMIVAARQGTEPLDAVFGVPGQARPLIFEGGFLYQHRLRELELAIAAGLATHLARPGDETGLEDALASVLAHPSAGVVPTGEQQSAIRRALAGPMAVISGGPGTGKTSIVVALLRAELARGRLGPEAIALAAPTGKAADRMRASIEHA